MQRKAEKFYRDHAVNPAYVERGLADYRAERGRLKAETVRLVCERCRKKLDEIRGPVELVYGRQWSIRERRMVGPATCKAWTCERCGGDYPVTLERMQLEYDDALRRRDKTIRLPLPRR